MKQLFFFEVFCFPFASHSVFGYHTLHKHISNNQCHIMLFLKEDLKPLLSSANKLLLLTALIAKSVFFLVFGCHLAVLVCHPCSV